jgi:hypothetical protein
MTEHPDCIKIAEQWLLAQRRTKNANTLMYPRPLKHIIEAWAARYVSEDDVVTAARNIGLKGRYPYFNIRAQFTRPRLSRLDNIETAGTMPNYRDNYQTDETYARDEQ